MNSNMFAHPAVQENLKKLESWGTKILPTDEKWIGITYQEDAAAARKEFARMAKEGIYPEKLWK